MEKKKTYVLTLLEVFPKAHNKAGMPTGFVCAGTNWAATDASVSSRLCFATKERAEAFGKQFQDLYNDFLL